MACKTTTTTIYAVIALLFVQLVLNDAADCKIKGQDLQTAGTFFYRANNAWQLLFSNTVPANTEIRVVCRYEENENFVQFELNARCLVSGQFEGALQDARCKDGIAAELVQQNAIGLDCPQGGRYGIGFNYDGQFHLQYTLCIDLETKLPVLTRHSVEKIFENAKDPKDKSFVIENYMTAYEANAFRTERVYESFLSQLGVNTYIPNKDTRAIDRGHLVPNGDFIFMSLRKSTYRNANIVPQMDSINQFGNWAGIENWIRQSVKQEKRLKQYTVITGTHGILKLENSERQLNAMRLLPPKLFPIPAWMFKVVSKGGQCFVFVTYNNKFNTPQQAPPDICNRVACPANIKPGRENGETYCCDVADFKSKIMPGLDICD